MSRGKLSYLAAFAALTTLLVAGASGHAHADAIPSDFNLQVTPSPLVTTVKPGTKTQLELKIRNGSSGTEQLKIAPRSFRISNDSNKITLLDTTPPDIAQWISFSQPKFTVAPGQWENEEVTLSVPKDAGFSYSFALVISRQNTPKSTGSGRVINGSLAVFTLVNIDRPDATTNLQIASFTASKHVYEYLPTTFSVRFHNAGNTIAQPYGNIFVGRGKSSQNPMASLTVNETHGYILPSTMRTITATWNDGFPSYETIRNPDGSTKQKLIWNWGDLSKLRIGRYTAHLVAVYSKNGRDTPIEGSVSFWVIPWKILLGVILVALLLLFAVFMLVRAIVRPVWRRTHNKKPPAEAETSTEKSQQD